MGVDPESVRLVLGRAWPSGIPDEEQALFDSLPDDRAALVLRRLSAILSVEDGEPVGAAASALGVDRPAFFRLRSAWSRSRSLRSITPFAGRAPRRLGPSTGDHSGLVEEVIRASSPNASARAMADEVVRRSGGSISLDASLGMVRAARMRLSADPNYLRDRFGRVLLVDVSAVSLAVYDAGDKVLPMAVAVVLDRASRLILGHSACVATAVLEGQKRAVQATAIVGSTSDGRRAPESAKLEVVIGYGPDGTVEELATAARLVGADVIDRGDSRCGSRLLSLMGHRLSRLRLRPRATNPSSIWAESTAGLSFAPMDQVRANALINEAVREHNRARLIGLAGNHGSDDGHLVERYLEKFVQLTSATHGVALLRQGCATLRSVFQE